MSEPTSSRRENRILVAIFVAALLLHFWLATLNWKAGFMPGHEFRQAQTAFISYFIDRDDDFSLLYEQPLMGKPWISVLLEVPVYEWSVVLLSRATGLHLVQAARTISLGCFYLMLPALWLLLARMNVPRHRRLLPLILTLSCPVYIFYSRSFLMESMELMCCAWFLVGFVHMMDRRRWPWFVLTTVAGTGASLIKSATFAVWLLPAAAYVVWLLWRDWRVRAGWSRLFDTTFWGLAGVAVPLGALRLWIQLTDPIKAAHSSAWIFTSANLSLGNWGLNDLSARFSIHLWGILLQRWQEALMPAWLVGVALVAGLLAFPAQRTRVAGVASFFFLAQLLFPYAYAYQEYYFYACAVFLLGGLGFALHGLLDSRQPRWLCWLLVAVLPVAQVCTYWQVYYPQQILESDGGFPFTEALRDYTPRESVLIVSGVDWAAMTPLYAQRRALLIRNGLVNDTAYLQRAFAELGDEEVSALVLVNDERRNTRLRDLAVVAFGFESRPTFSQDIADVYCHPRYIERMKRGLKERHYWGGNLKVSAPDTFPPANTGRIRVNDGLARSAFSMVSPAPIQAEFKFGMGSLLTADGPALNAHPDSNLWLRSPMGATRIEWDYGMMPLAWEREGDKTDGVEFIVTGIVPGRSERVIYRRKLDPVLKATDRAWQHEIIPFQPLPGEFLRFSTRPRAAYSYDWAYWKRIEVK